MRYLDGRPELARNIQGHIFQKGHNQPLNLVTAELEFALTNNSLLQMK